MSVVTASSEWTVDDLADLPDDGRRYELFDGDLVVSPAPFPLHQMASRALFRLLDRACPPDLEVFYAPVDFQPARTRSFQPDLLVARRTDVDPLAVLTAAPVLTVEVLSHSTRAIDRGRKREMYATSGVDNYWIFDPQRPDFVAYERKDAAYVEVARAQGEERITVRRPYPVEICPAEIATG